MNPDRLQYAWMACKSSHPSGDYSVLDTSRERLLPGCQSIDRNFVGDHIQSGCPILYAVIGVKTPNVLVK